MVLHIVVVGCETKNIYIYSFLRLIALIAVIAEIPACNSTILHPGVQEVIPPERLLVYNWSDGWAPLAHFLGTAIPEEEFPHEDPVRSHFEKVTASGDLTAISA